MEFINQKELKDKVGIYQIKNLKNNKIYIGQTSDRFIERYWNHLWKLTNNKHDNDHLQKSFNKYGTECFEFSVLHILQPEENIDELERKYINQYDKNILYNIQNGGQDFTMKDVPMSENTKKKIGIKNHYNIIGKKHSESTKQKMSEVRKNKTQWGKCLITYEQAELIKTLLMSGKTPKEVSEQICIDYKIVNNIYSSNTYKSVVVEGWDEFYKNSRKSKNLTDEQIQYIKKIFKETQSISKTNKITGFSRKAIRKYI